MGRRLAVLGSAPALEEAAEEEGVEDAISSVVPGPIQLQSRGVLGLPSLSAKRSESCAGSLACGRSPSPLEVGGGCGARGRSPFSPGHGGKQMQGQ